MRGISLQQNNIKVVSEQEMAIQHKYAEKCSETLKNKYHERIPLCYVHSYGCQGNVADGEKIKGILAEIGYGITGSYDNADIVIYNTCAIRENAENHVYGNVGELTHEKKRRRDLIIGLCGCMVQQEHIAEKIKRSYPSVDLVFGTHALHKLPELLYSVFNDKKRVFDIPQSDGVIVEDLPVARESEYKASVPIMYGCDNFCAYCVVPYVRGRERSREASGILNEITELVSNGYKEIMLLGQNVNSYGKNVLGSPDFADLLKMINDIPGDFRIRFMTSHPKDATRKLIDTMAECDKVCNHLHLPVQSGSNRVLKLMNRSYTKEQYLELVGYIKKRIPDISLTSDIIVGFPGETYEDFSETLELIKQVEYSSLFTFIFSSRVGTTAAKMDDPIASKEKSKWFQELLKVQEDISIDVLMPYRGKVMRVLADGIGRTGEGSLLGKNEQSIVVDFPGNKELIGRFVDVEITNSRRLALLGRII